MKADEEIWNLMIRRWSLVAFSASVCFYAIAFYFSGTLFGDTTIPFFHWNVPNDWFLYRWIADPIFCYLYIGFIGERIYVQMEEDRMLKRGEPHAPKFIASMLTGFCIGISMCALHYDASITLLIAACLGALCPFIIGTRFNYWEQDTQDAILGIYIGFGVAFGLWYGLGAGASLFALQWIAFVVCGIFSLILCAIIEELPRALSRLFSKFKRWLLPA